MKKKDEPLSPLLLNKDAIPTTKKYLLHAHSILNELLRVASLWRGGFGTVSDVEKEVLQSIGYALYERERKYLEKILSAYDNLRVLSKTQYDERAEAYRELSKAQGKLFESILGRVTKANQKSLEGQKPLDI